MTLSEFLLARIAEDESDLIAHRVRCRYIETDTYGECDCSGPARVLVECEAKRVLIDRDDGHTNNWMSDLDNDPDSRVYGSFCTVDNEAWPCWTVRMLALPYADHPDYRQEWRP